MLTTLPSKRLVQSIVCRSGTRIPYGFSVVRAFSTGSTDQKEEPPKEKGGFLNRLYGKESNSASPSFKNRWAMILPAMMAHMCIGSPYAWSVMGDQLTRQNGFVASAASDWSLMQAALPLSIVFACHGVTASIAGKWQLKVGPRKALAAAACAFGGGLLLGAAGIYTHCLPLVYAGYGALGGAGIGLSYTPPIQTLFQWFPDKKGIASGLCVAGFGSGALVFSPLVQYLMRQYSKLPEYLGPAKDFVTSTIDGRLFAQKADGSLVEVVQAGTAELAKLPYALSEGLYVVGTGSTGAAEALATMGFGYFSIMMLSSLLLRGPHASYVPPHSAPAATSTAAAAAAPAPTAVTDITVDEAVRTRQFYLMGATLLCVSSGGMGLFSVAKPMMSEVFSAALPTIATSAFASSFVLMLSMGNLGGRLGWAAISDWIGRRPVFTLFTVGSIPLYMYMPTLVDTIITTKEALPLYAFCGGTTLAVSMMGGMFSCLPALEADLFGAKYVGAIHGRMLLFMSAASIGGNSVSVIMMSMMLLDVLGYDVKFTRC